MYIGMHVIDDSLSVSFQIVSKFVNTSYVPVVTLWLNDF